MVVQTEKVQMKTVIVGQVPVRLSDRKAYQIVHDKGGQYCPKHVYKEHVKRQKPKIEESPKYKVIEDNLGANSGHGS